MESLWCGKRAAPVEALASAFCTCIARLGLASTVGIGDITHRDTVTTCRHRASWQKNGTAIERKARTTKTQIAADYVDKELIHEVRGV